MSYSATGRRNGVLGTANLFRRQEWRESEYGPALEQIMRSAVEDDDPISRFHAALVIRRLEPDAVRALDLIRRRLLVDPESHVAAILTQELSAVGQQLPAKVDAVVAELEASSLWQTRL